MSTDFLCRVTLFRETGTNEGNTNFSLERIIVDGLNVWLNSTVTKLALKLMGSYEGWSSTADPFRLCRPMEQHGLRVPVHAKFLRNGDVSHPTIVMLPSTLDKLLEKLTEKLELVFAARRLFRVDGEEIHRLIDIEEGDQIIVSCGEPLKSSFIDPYRHHITLTTTPSKVHRIATPSKLKISTTTVSSPSKTSIRLKSESTQKEVTPKKKIIRKEPTPTAKRSMRGLEGLAPRKTKLKDASVKKTTPAVSSPSKVKERTSRVGSKIDTLSESVEEIDVVDESPPHTVPIKKDERPASKMAIPPIVYTDTFVQTLSIDNVSTQTTPRLHQGEIPKTPTVETPNNAPKPLENIDLYTIQRALLSILTPGLNLSHPLPPGLQTPYVPPRPETPKTSTQSIETDPMMSETTMFESIETELKKQAEREEKERNEEEESKKSNGRTSGSIFLQLPPSSDKEDEAISTSVCSEAKPTIDVGLHLDSICDSISLEGCPPGSPELSKRSIGRDFVAHSPRISLMPYQEEEAVVESVYHYLPPEYRKQGRSQPSGRVLR
ncbi:proteoglycan 4-like [Planoprotostelium fungivorum]|uniref:Proteoglycan 4-like n=1 Tax=Planoprotostelium fungivorum TaxID=1890364 RepID=A0A2P6NE34_9EUKA|nr:proteoglycan 4-like [Planoprotostelium fungivorum]